MPPPPSPGLASLQSSCLLHLSPTTPDFPSLSHDISNLLQNVAPCPSTGDPLSLSMKGGEAATAATLLRAMCARDPAAFSRSLSVSHSSLTSLSSALTQFDPHSLAVEVLRMYIFPAHPSGSFPRLVRDMAGQVAWGGGEEGIVLPDGGLDGHVLGSVDPEPSSPQPLGSRYSAMRSTLFSLSSSHDYETIAAILRPGSDSLLEGPSALASASLSSFRRYPRAGLSAVNGNMPPSSSLHFIDEDRRTALHHAASSVPLPSSSSFSSSSPAALTVATLLDLGASIDARDCQGRTPLHLAATAGSPYAALALLSRLADPKALDLDLRTPLHLALSSSPRLLNNRSAVAREAAVAAVAEALAGAPGGSKVLDLPDKYGMAPIGLAALSGSVAALDALANGGGFRFEEGGREGRGWGACRQGMLCAVRSGSAKVLRCVLRKITGDFAASRLSPLSPLSPPPPPPSSSSSLSLLSFPPPLLPYLSSLLPLAVSKGLLKMTKALLDHGAAVDTCLKAPTEQWDASPPQLPAEGAEGAASSAALGMTPLHLAVSLSDSILVAVLLRHGADPFKQSHRLEALLTVGFSSTESSRTGESFRVQRPAGLVCPLVMAIALSRLDCAKAFLSPPSSGPPAVTAAALHEKNPSLDFNVMNAVVLGNDGERNKNLPILDLLFNSLPAEALRDLASQQDGCGSASLALAAAATSPEMVAALVDRARADVSAVRSEESSDLLALKSSLSSLSSSLPPLKSSLATSLSLVPLFSPAKEAANVALSLTIEAAWTEALLLLEEPDPDLRRKGGKTEGARQIQALAAAKGPPGKVMSVLTYAYCLILDVKGLGSTDPGAYDPRVEPGPPSWWPAFRRSARNLRVGSKMMSARGEKVAAEKARSVSSLDLPAGFKAASEKGSKWGECERAFLKWIEAFVKECDGKASADYDSRMIEYIQIKKEVAAAEAEVTALALLVADSPTSTNCLSICLRDPAPSLLSRGYGAAGPARVAERTQDVALCLIEKGAAVDVPDVTGEAAVTVACRKGYWRVALAIIERGADVSGARWSKAGMVRFNDSPRQNSTPLDFASHRPERDPASRADRLAVLRELLLRGAQVTPAAVANAIRAKDEVITCILFAAENALSFSTAGLNYGESADRLAAGKKAPKKTVARVAGEGRRGMTFEERVANNDTSSALLPTAARTAAESFSFVRIDRGSESISGRLGRVSYGSVDSSAHVCLNMLAVASGSGGSARHTLYRSEVVDVAHGSHRFPGGPSAIFTVLDGKTAILPSTVSHPLSSLLIDVESQNVLLGDSSSVPFASIFTGPLKERHYKDFLRILVSPDVPHTDSAVQMAHSLARIGDVELLSCLFNGAEYVSRASRDVARDMVFRGDVDRKSALYLALENGNVDSSRFLFHQMSKSVREQDLENKGGGGGGGGGGTKRGVRVRLSPPSSQFRKLFVDRAKIELNQKSAMVIEAAKFPYQSVSGGGGIGGGDNPLLSARASMLLESLTHAGRCFAKLEAFNSNHLAGSSEKGFVLDSLEGRGGDDGVSDDDESKWIIDQLGVVRAARSVLRSLNLLGGGEGWSEDFKTAMHFPSTLDAKKYVSLQSVGEIKHFMQPAEWQRLAESGELSREHVVASNCDLCKINGASVLMDTSGGSSGRSGGGDAFSVQPTSMIPQDVLREARSKWALEDALEEAAEKEVRSKRENETENVSSQNSKSNNNVPLSVVAHDNDDNDNNRVRPPNSPSKQRSRRFMRFIDAWRKSNNNGQAQNAIRAANLVLEWTRVIVKVRVLLQAVYADSSEVGKKREEGVVVDGKFGKGGDENQDPMSMLRRFDAAVGEEHEAALVYGEVAEMAKKIDEAEAEASTREDGTNSRWRMRLRCMDVVDLDTWRSFFEGGKNTDYVEVARIICQGDDVGSEAMLRQLQQVDLHEFAVNGAEEKLEQLKRVKLDESNEHVVADCMRFLVRSLVNSHDAPAIKFARELDYHDNATVGNALVPCIRKICKPVHQGGSGDAGLLQAMLSGGMFSVLDKDAVTGVSSVEAASVDGNDRVLHMLLSSGKQLGGEMGEDAAAALSGKIAKGLRDSEGVGLLKRVLDAAPAFERIPRNVKSGKNASAVSKNKGAAQESFGVVLHTLLDAGYDDFKGRVVEIAARKGYVGLVERLVEAGANACIDREGEGGMSALHWACASGHDQLAKVILSKLGKENEDNEEKGEEEKAEKKEDEEEKAGEEEGGGMIEKEDAIRFGHVEKNKREGRGGTAGEEMEAKMEGMSEKMKAKVRVKLEASVKKKEDRAVTITPVWPLHLACRGGHTRVVELLLEEAGVQEGGGDGIFSLGFECLGDGSGGDGDKRRLDCLEMLLRAGYDCTKAGYCLQLRKRVEGGALEAAVVLGRSKAVKLMLGWEGGKLVEEKCVTGEAAVACLKRGSQVAFIEIVTAVRRRDGEAAFETDVIVNEDSGERLLHVACRTGQEKAVRFLMGLGCDLEAVDAKGLTGVHYSIGGGHGEITKLLGERLGEVRRAAGTIIQKIRFFVVVLKKVQAEGKGRESVKSEQFSMLALGASHGALKTPVVSSVKR